MITKKDESRLHRLSVETTDKGIVAFLIKRVFDVEILQDIPFLSCGNCASWCGRCLRGVRGKIAADIPCLEFVPRTEATFSTIPLKVF